jgi:hypothetical protein
MWAGPDTVKNTLPYSNCSCFYKRDLFSDAIQIHCKLFQEIKFRILEDTDASIGIGCGKCAAHVLVLDFQIAKSAELLSTSSCNVALPLSPLQPLLELFQLPPPAHLITATPGLVFASPFPVADFHSLLRLLDLPGLFHGYA